MSNPKHKHVVRTKNKETGLMFDRCPKAWLQTVGQDLTYAIRDVSLFHQHGTLPEAGGWLDQHPHWIQVEAIVSGIGDG